jgi:hypothetical protein
LNGFMIASIFFIASRLPAPKRTEESVVEPTLG